ncbi:MAG: hypothetical protein JWN34_908 [Bryobacterales bacterium]|jgi:hypothetical protein|nr:hypothetical protein [Bryobacterales bacterium]
MPAFPALKTGAVSQYPATVKICFGPSDAVNFLDGSSQRYSTGPKPLRQWIVRFEQLDAREEAALVEFLQKYHQVAFTFLDPFTGETISRCGLRGSEFIHAVTGELNRAASAVIEELR